jgi:hypothetical protein
MRYDNPTSVKLGMTGEFVGKRYRVAGRVVMSMEEAGGTYYWNEFHLVGDDGRDATLVYEETENGPEWRLFTLLEPAPPLTVAEAAARRVGETIQIEDKTLRITCVDESRVCAIEGEAPEGVEKGDVARYFNAESGSEMIVVSWTGEELEVYRGITLPGHAVTSAFGITGIPSGALDHLSSSPDDTGKKIKGWIILIALLTTVGAIVSVRLTRRQSPELPRLPKAQLAIGSTGRLNSAPYHITGRAEIEIDSVGRRYLRHEYSAVDDAGNASLIWQGTEQGADKWMLLTPITPTHGLTPRAAGALRLGDGIAVDETILRVTQHFLTRVQKVAGAAPLPPGELYGFAARGTNGVVVARWNENAITFYRAISPSEKNPAKTFR